jgi:AraC family transcriptional regulator
MQPTTPDRLRQLIDTILGALDERIEGDALAKRSYLSRFHFDRLVRRGLGEAPTTFRRRLLLERAAWQLLQSTSVTDAGLGAGYGSTEAFSRAFTRAYAVPPSRFALERPDFRLSAPNGIHFHPPGGLYIAGHDRSTTMDLTDRLLSHDAWVTERVLECAAQLSDAELDREIWRGHVVFRFDGPESSVRTMLANHVFAKEVWVAAMSGTGFPSGGDKTVLTLRTRHEVVAQRLREIVRGIRDRGEWDDAFVDALCEPPQSFSYGAVIAHLLSHAAHRRAMLLAALRELGVQDVVSGDPIDWEMQQH